MHAFATDSAERMRIPLLVALASLFSAWTLYWAFEVTQVRIPWWLDTPSVIGFYGLYYGILDLRLWRSAILQKLKLVEVPDIRGTWIGHISSSSGGFATELEARLDVIQNWTRISIELVTETSRSRSVVASIATHDLVKPIISYEYLNEPLPNAPESMHPHRGTARLELSSNGSSLEGEYYSGRGRLNVGILQFQRSLGTPQSSADRPHGLTEP